jgi:hypothetical protein
MAAAGFSVQTKLPLRRLGGCRTPPRDWLAEIGRSFAQTARSWLLVDTAIPAMPAFGERLKSQ